MWAGGVELCDCGWGCAVSGRGCGGFVMNVGGDVWMGGAGAGM